MLKSALKRALDQIDPERKRVRKRTPTSESQCVKETRYVSASLRKQIWVRDRGRCTYIDPLTKNKYESRYGLQMDHVIPFAHGGSSSDAHNLRLLCQAHNQLLAIQQLGGTKMLPYLNSS